MRTIASLGLSLGAVLGVCLGIGSFQGCGGDTCAECQEENCGDLLSLCDEDPDCSCVASCTGDNGFPAIEDCLESCMLSERPTAFGPLEECVGIACPDGDECSSRGVHTAPDPFADVDTPGPGGGTLADCEFDPDQAFEPEGPTLQLESEDGEYCLRLERRDDGAGTNDNTAWTLLDVRLGPAGEVAHVDDPSNLCFYASHHNFLDYAHIWTGSTHHDLKLIEVGHGGDRIYELYTWSEGPIEGTCDATLDGEDPIGFVELFPVNG